MAIIHLDSGFHRNSSGLPGNSDGPSSRHRSALRFPIWPCSVRGLPSRSVTGSLVRSYRTFSPLPRPGNLVFQVRHLISHFHSDHEVLSKMGNKVSDPSFLTPAVCFLWHFPSLSGPRITGHTALRSSDFPLPFGSDCPLTHSADTSNIETKPDGGHSFLQTPRQASDCSLSHKRSSSSGSSEWNAMRFSVTG